jgi:hypothetical protein
MRELFIHELKAVQGGHHKPNHGGGPPFGGGCPEPTTLACGEEANGCSGC